MDVPAAILTRSLHKDHPLVQAIAGDARDSSFAILTPEIEPRPPSTADAARTLDASIARLGQLIAQGPQPLVGPLQVPLSIRYKYVLSAPNDDAPIFPALPERHAWGSDCLFGSPPTRTPGVPVTRTSTPGPLNQSAPTTVQ